MPRLSCWFIRASLVYLVLGFSLGGLLLVNKALPLNAVIWRLLPSHIEFLLIGWVIELAMGMIFWILPRFSAGAPRGKEALIWASFVLVNLGIWMVVGQSFFPLSGLEPAGRLLETVAAVMFGIGSWRWVKPFQG